MSLILAKGGAHPERRRWSTEEGLAVGVDGAVHLDSQIGHTQNQTDDPVQGRLSGRHQLPRQPRQSQGQSLLLGGRRIN